MRSLRAREAWSAFMVFIAWLCAGIAASLLAIIVVYVVQRVAGEMNAAFFTLLPAPPGFWAARLKGAAAAKASCRARSATAEDPSASAR